MLVYLAENNGKMKILSALMEGVPEVDAYIYGRSNIGKSSPDVAKYLQRNQTRGVSLTKLKS